MGAEMDEDGVPALIQEEEEEEGEEEAQAVAGGFDPMECDPPPSLGPFNYHADHNLEQTYAEPTGADMVSFNLDFLYFRS